MGAARRRSGLREHLENAVLSKTCTGNFHELKDLHELAVHMGAAKRPQRQSKCRRALALAVAGVHDDEAAAFAFGLLVALLRGG